MVVGCKEARPEVASMQATVKTLTAAVPIAMRLAPSRASASRVAMKVTV